MRADPKAYWYDVKANVCAAFKVLRGPHRPRIRMRVNHPCHHTGCTLSQWHHNLQYVQSILFINPCTLQQYISLFHFI